MTYFTADTHFGHNREFIYEQRGFYTIEKHDKCLLDSINYTVKTTDILYILGDIAWVNPIKFLNSMWCQNIYIIRGNHDDELYSLHQQKKFINATLLNEIVSIKINKQLISLSHFPMVCWEKSHYNSWSLYGHVHLKELPIHGKMFDVAPSKDHLHPYSFEEIAETMKNKPDNWDLIK